jgi:hypothetical protein
MSDLIHNKPSIESEQKVEDPLKSYPAKSIQLKMRFGQQEVFEGVPNIPVGSGEAPIPYEPYIFRPDECEIYSEDLPARLHLVDPVVLVMHGELRTDRVFPKFSKSNLDVYPLAEIVAAYEKERELKIDILAVCMDNDVSTNPDNSNIRLFSTLLQRPVQEFKDKVHPIYDKAVVNISRDEGKAKLVLTTVSQRNLYVPERFKSK